MHCKAFRRKTTPPDLNSDNYLFNQVGSFNKLTLPDPNNDNNLFRLGRVVHKILIERLAILDTKCALAPTFTTEMFFHKLLT